MLVVLANLMVPADGGGTCVTQSVQWSATSCCPDCLCASSSSGIQLGKELMAFLSLELIYKLLHDTAYLEPSDAALAISLPF